MGKTRKTGRCLESLVKLALPVLKQAERENPRIGRGDRPDHPDWFMAVLIMIVVLKKKKGKSAQFRFLYEHRQEIAEWTGQEGFPSRPTYFRRYRQAHELYRSAIRLQGELAIKEGIADPHDVAIDKSLAEALGEPWHKSDQAAGKQPAGVDVEATWGFSVYHDWVFGYSFEVVVTATAGTTVFPLSASVGVASTSEMKTCPEKIAQLPEGVVNASLDSAYDANALAEQMEYDAEGKKNGRHFLCPENPRHNSRAKTKPCGADKSRGESRRRRAERKKYFESRKGKAIYGRRKKTVEPFNQWLKSLFELNDKVWHRGLANNQTQMLAAIFAYQLLVRYNHKQGNENGKVCWILDKL
jgi:hypothetical protein